MKNIHVITRLGNLTRCHDIRPIKESLGNNVNIYITSDEEIKGENWFVNFDLLGRLDTICNPIHKCLKVNNNVITSFEVEVEDEFTILKSYCKKIILTTDSQLIQDGVQSIPDEFLEWFVKNPSCKEVDVKIDTYIDKSISESEIFINYKVIIPKEESKQIYYNTVGRENGVFVIKGQFKTQKEALDLANELNRKFPDLYYDWNETLIKEEPKHKIDTCYNFNNEIGCVQAYCRCEKEEPKQDYNSVHLAHCYQSEYEDGCKYGENDCPAKPKQETLEEAAEERYPEDGSFVIMDIDIAQYQQFAFIEGAKSDAAKAYWYNIFKQNL